MNTEQKLFSLMGLAEDQSKINQALLQELVRELKLIHRDEINELKKERERIAYTYKNMAGDVYELRAQQKRNVIYTFLFCFLIGVTFILGTLFYIDVLRTDINEMRENITQLKFDGGEADVFSCTKNNKAYPCIRVMRSWGAFGEDRDIYIIDPK